MGPSASKNDQMVVLDFAGDDSPLSCAPIHLVGAGLESSNNIGDGNRQNSIDEALKERRAHLDFGDQTHAAVGARTRFE